MNSFPGWTNFNAIENRLILNLQSNNEKNNLEAEMDDIDHEFDSVATAVISELNALEVKTEEFVETGKCRIRKAGHQSKIRRSVDVVFWDNCFPLFYRLVRSVPSRVPC